MSANIIRGFKVICDKWSPPLATIVRARSASKARFKCWDGARDVGYRLKIGDFKVRRAPEYDDAKLIEGRCYGEDFARSILPENAAPSVAQPVPPDLARELRRVTREIFDLHKHPEMRVSVQRHLDKARETMGFALVDHEFHSNQIKAVANNGLRPK